MKLKIFDTIKRAKVTFSPINQNHIKIYVCGPTVYDLPHIGNARPVVVFDTLVRLLRSHYPKVTYVRNITDVDDKINQRSIDSGENINTITKRTAQIFSDDMSSLNALPPDIEPLATKHIDEMQSMIKTLIKKEHAYEAAGHVLFNVSSMPTYGKLSQLNKREIISGARVDIAPYKRAPQDFVLWKPSNEQLPGWESPWGRGRPGWHIECSAMSYKHLGDKFDIHGGGQDLIFPHHENELAQSKCALGNDSFAKYWMHNGYLMSEGEKMSKSIGNFYTVRNLLEDFPGEAIRLLLLKTHYRQPLDFVRHRLLEAKLELDKFYHSLSDSVSNSTEETSPEDSFMSAVCDDLNTPLAISKLHENLKDLNKATVAKKKDSLKSKLLANAKILGLLQSTPQNWFAWQPKLTVTPRLSSRDVELLIKKRTLARQNKKFKESDQIRDQLVTEGVILEDGESGTTWRRS